MGANDIFKVTSEVSFYYTVLVLHLQGKGDMIATTLPPKTDARVWLHIAIDSTW